jgi:hypothetical protein
MPRFGAIPVATAIFSLAEHAAAAWARLPHESLRRGGWLRRTSPSRSRYSWRRLPDLALMRAATSRRIVEVGAKDMMLTFIR